MAKKPQNTVFAPHAFVGIKDSQFDMDRLTVLTAEVAGAFASHMNTQFNSEKADALFANKDISALARIINKESLFPFTASIEDGSVVLVPALNKTNIPYVLKNISDGITEICKTFSGTAKLTEQGKFALAMLFQPPLYHAYHAAGMTEGAHSKYVTRSC